MHKDWGELAVQFSAWAALQNSHIGHLHNWKDFGSRLRPIEQPTRLARKLRKTQLKNNNKKNHCYHTKFQAATCELTGRAGPKYSPDYNYHGLSFNWRAACLPCPKVRHKNYPWWAIHTQKSNFTFKLNFLSTSFPCRGLQRSRKQLGGPVDFLLGCLGDLCKLSLSV